MDRTVSQYLDTARFLAAFAVLLSHLEETWTPGLFPFFTHLGLAAVGVFFVLSGFVIAYVTDGRETTARAYTVSRAARLYSVVIPCLALTFILDVAGTALMPHHYAAGWPHLPGPKKELAQIAVSLTFMNTLWGHHLVPGSNGPYWSLCSEAIYYAIFGLFVFVKGGWRWLWSGLACLIAGPLILSLFPLWLLGVACYRACRRLSLSTRLGRTILLGSLVFWLVCEAIRWRFNIGMVAPGSQPRTELQFYAAGIPFAASLIGLWFSGLPGVKHDGVIRWLAGSTFTLYLLHFPLSRFLDGLMPAAWPPLDRWAVLITLNVLAALVVARVTEQRKTQWRAAIERGVARVRPKSVQAPA